MALRRMPSMLLRGSCATHPKAWFMVLVSQTSRVNSPPAAHDHQQSTRHSRVTPSMNHADGMTMKLLSRNHVLKRPKW